jgi:hypothetical protein
MTTSPSASHDPGHPGRGEGAAPTPLEVAEAFEHAHADAQSHAHADADPAESGGVRPAPEPAAPGSGAPGSGAPGADDLADRVVAAVLAVPGVVRLHAGVFGEVATYLPGRAVTGVRIRPDETEVHLVVADDRPIPAVARDVHEAVHALSHGPVRVFVEDVESSPSSPSRPTTARAERAPS